MLRFSCAFLLGITASTAAFAHASLETTQAPTGSYYTAVIRITHGCNGSPTKKVMVKIPEGATSVRPQPKPGWNLHIIKTKLDQPYKDAHGREISERVSEVHWTDGKLLDEHYDEFRIRLKLPEAPPGTVAYFPTVQECEQGAHRWIEIPQPGQKASELREPAPAVTLTAKP